MAFSFLPNIYKAELEKEYRRRVTAVGLALAALAIFIGAVLSLPAFILLSVKLHNARISASANRAVDASANAAMETRVADLRSKTDLLKGVADTRTMVSVIERINARMVSGISLNGVSIKRSETGSEILVSGTAKTRDDLVTYSKSLQGEPSFSSVTLPVSALAKSKDAAFSIAIASRL